MWNRWCSVRLGVAAETSRFYHTIEAIPRELTGRRAAVKERSQGRIPAVVFAHNYLQKNPIDRVGNAVTVRSVSRKQLLTTERNQIKSILDSVELPFFCSTTFGLQILAGSGSSTVLESGKVLPIKIHRDPNTGKVLNLVLVWADEGTQLRVDVPLVFKGEDDCPGIKKGGCLNRIRSSLKYICPSEHIPPKIEVDVSKLDIGDRVFMRDIEVHPSLKLLSKDESLPVCKIVTIKQNSELAE